jgi:uroporphyrin-3 C-methyltransferase
MTMTQSPVATVWKSLILITLLLIAAVIWFVYQTDLRQQKRWQHQQQVQQTQQQQQLESIQQLTQHLDRLQESLQAMQQEQENLRAIIAGGAERFAEAQRMHAAEYLVLEAEKVLMLAQDVPSVMRLLETAHAQLAGSQQLAAQQLRAAIQRDQQQLRGLLAVDPLAAARRLSELQTHVTGLRSLAPVLKEKPRTSLYDAEQDTWWGQLKANVAQFSGDWFLVRDHAQGIAAPLNDTEARQIKQAISLSLANAQAAALRHEQGLYYNAINDALLLLNLHYGSDPSTVTLSEELKQLSQKLVSVTATLSLVSAQTVRGDKPVVENTP